MKDRKMSGIFFATLAVAMAFGSWPALAQEPVFDMKGTWTGRTSVAAIGQHKHTGHSAPEAKFYDVELTYEIDKQEGRLFVGRKITEKLTEDIIGVVAYDNRSFYVVDSNGKMIGKLNSSTEIETYYMEATPTAMVVAVNRLERQP